MAESPASARTETNFDGEVAYITLSHPPVNVIDFETISEILLFIESLVTESRLCCVVLKAAGPAFSGGVDVAAHLPDTVRRMIGEFHRVFEYLLRLFLGDEMADEPDPDRLGSSDRLTRE